MISAFFNRHSQVNWALADQTIVSGSNFLTGIMIARLLGIKEFGIFTMIWIGVLFVNSIQMAMITSPMMTVGPKQNCTDNPVYYGAVFFHQTVFAILSSGLLWVAVCMSDRVWPEWGVSHLAAPLAVALLFFQTQDFLKKYLFTENLPKAAFTSDIISHVGKISLLVVLFFTTTVDLQRVLWIISITSALALYPGICVIKHLTFDKASIMVVFKRHWLLSKWMTASTVLYWTSAQYFIIAAGMVLGPVAVGAIKAAQSITGILSILLQGLGNVVPAAASRHFIENGRVGLQKYLTNISMIGGTFVFVAAFCIGMYPDKLMVLIFGNQYQGYGQILRLFSVYTIVSFFTLPLSAGLRVLEVTRPIFIGNCATAIFSILVANYFAQQWGLEGVVLGMIASVILASMILLHYLKFHLREKIGPEVAEE